MYKTLKREKEDDKYSTIEGNNRWKEEVKIRKGKYLPLYNSLRLDNIKNLFEKKL